MAFTTDQYNTLTTAISQGANRVKYADKEVQYDSLSDMLRLKRIMEIEPTSLHQNITIALGSPDTVTEMEEFLEKYAVKPL